MRLGNRGYSRQLIEMLIEKKVKNKAFLKDHVLMTELLEKTVSVGYQNGNMVHDEEHGLFELVVEKQDNGSHKVKIGWELIFRSHGRRSFQPTGQLNGNRPRETGPTTPRLTRRCDGWTRRTVRRVQGFHFFVVVCKHELN